MSSILKKITNGPLPYFIAEIGVNHECSLNEAKKLDSHGLLNQQIKLMQTQMKRI